MNNKTNIEVKNYNAKKIERPGKTLEEIEAEVNAFNQEQLELAQKND